MNKTDRLLKESGAKLIRKKKHEVWRLPNGKQFVRATTTSDRNSDHNNFSDLRKLLGQTPRETVVGERRKFYKPRHEKQTHISIEPTFNTELADKLKLAGVAEDTLKERCEYAELQINYLNETIDEIVAENEQIKKHWWHRFGKWLRIV